MAKKTTVAIAHNSADLGKPGECSRQQLDLVKQMIRQVADQTMGGMQKIVKRGDKVLIKVNTVIPVPPNAGFTTDPRMLEALVELVAEQNPSRIQIGERCAMGADTRGKQELDEALVASAALFADEPAQAVGIGECQAAFRSGLITPRDIRATLGEVAAGLKPGRLSPQEVTLFDGTGVALQDLVVAQLALICAEERGLGSTVEY